MAKKQYAVIGLGRFGTSVAEKLYEAGQDVLGIDINEELIEGAESLVTHAVVADCTVEKALTSLGIRNFDCVIVAIGSDIQASILTVMLLKEQGVQKIIAKAINKRHGQVLEKIGADWIVYPEWDMGQRVANQLLSPNVLNYIKLSKEYNIEEIKIPAKMAGKSLRQLDIRAKYHVTVIGIVRGGEIIVSPSADEILLQEDCLVTVGKSKDLERFAGVEQ